MSAARRQGIATAAVFLLLGGAAVGRACTAQEKETMGMASGITVQGIGEVMVKPDIARLQLGVQTQAKEAAQAASDNAERTSALIRAVRAAGVAEKDIQTSGYGISPQYDYSQQKPGAPPVLVNYQVNNTVRVIVRKIGDASKVLDAAIKAGANVAGGIAFDLDDPTAARAEALRKAVSDAALKAKVIAAAANLGEIVLQSVTEGGGFSSPRPMMEMGAMRSMAVADAAQTPVAPGEQTIRATVTVRYRINASPPVR